MYKQMLVIGSNGGIGKKCVEYFSTLYDVIPISREQGDLKNKIFLKMLIDRYNPSIVINCAGVYQKDLYETFEINLLSASFLTLEFYKKMSRGHIINICSSSANSSGWSGMDFDRISYNVSKSSLKKFSNMLQLSKNKSVKISTIEPAQIDTKMLKHTSKDIVPIKTSYIVEIIHWILNQPDSVVISSIEIQNMKL